MSESKTRSIFPFMEIAGNGEDPITDLSHAATTSSPDRSSVFPHTPDSGLGSADTR